MSKSGAQIQNPRGTTDRGTSGEHAAGGVGRAAPVGPPKRGKSHIFEVVLVRLHQYFGPGIVSLAPLLLVPINCPLVFYRGGIQIVEFLK